MNKKKFSLSLLTLVAGVALMPIFVSAREPISKTPSSRVARDFLFSARRTEEGVARATSTKVQRSVRRKSPQSLRDMANHMPRGVAADSEYRGYALALAPGAAKDWPISRPKEFLRLVQGGVFTRTLRQGVSGIDVKQLQLFLAQSPDLYPEGLITGYFGPLTETAVKKLQSKYGIEAAGIVGPKTRSKLNEIMMSAGAQKTETKSVPSSNLSTSTVASAPSVTTIYTTDAVNIPTKIIIGNDGNPVVAFYNHLYLDLVYCGDADCAEKTYHEQELINSMHTWSASIGAATDPGGGTFAMIESDPGAIFAHCDERCNEHSLVKLGWLGQYYDIAVGIGGLPIISYLKSTYTNGAVSGWELGLLKCGNVRCDSHNATTTLDRFDYRITGVSPATRISMAIGTDKLPIVAYQGLKNGKGTLNILKCGDAACDSGNTITVADDEGDTGFYPSLAIGQDGFPVVGYFKSDLGALQSDLRFLHCGTPSCASGNSIHMMDSGLHFGRNVNLVIGSDGLPLLVYDTRLVMSAISEESEFKAAHCSNPYCSTDIKITPIEQSGNVGGESSVVLGARGLPVVSFADVHDDLRGTDVRVLKCGDVICSVLPDELKPKVSPLPPDLVVKNNGYGYQAFGPLTQGMKMGFNALVENVGGGWPPSSTARLRIDENADGTWDGVFTLPVPPLLGGTWYWLHWTNTWTARGGTHRFEICADASGEIPESDETNNCAIDAFTVQ